MKNTERIITHLLFVTMLSGAITGQCYSFQDEQKKTNKEEANSQHSYYRDKILFHAVPDNADGEMFDLFVMNLNGSDKKNLTNTPDLHEVGTWTKNGKIVCKQLQWKGMEGWKVIGWQVRRCYIMNNDGSNRREISEDFYRTLVEQSRK